MICYQDEYLSNPEEVAKMNPDEIEAEIERLEMEWYGRILPKDLGEHIERKPMIYSVKQHKLVERETILGY